MLSPREAAAGSYGCPLPDRIENTGGGPFVGNLSFYHFNIIISGACTGTVLFLTLGLMGRHATHMSNPDEQLKIMRIINMIPSYQILSFVSIGLPNSYIYLQGFTEVFQGVALYAFLMLLCDFLAPTDQGKVEFFSSLETKRQWQPKKKRNGLAFLSLTWWSVVQYPIVTWVAAVAQVLTQLLHKYCLGSTAPHFAHVWLTAATSLSTSVAVNAILQFYMNMKEHMKAHHPMTKLLAFKLAVGLVILEKILFLILEGVGVLHASNTLTYVDIMMGLPELIICVQMVPLSFLLLYAYRTKPYELLPGEDRPREYQALGGSDHDHDDDSNDTLIAEGSRGQQRYHGGWMGLHAWAAYLSPLSLLMAVISGHRLISRARALHKVQMEQARKAQEWGRYQTRYDPPTTTEGA
ncbi:transmembrane protein [Aspergillus pseudoustus]|uniref:Transmembrane protein n=1 Tax=Aspergillus pseudoustus TaxID=1810923 RepID=A0ABR4IYC2_9EURO